MAKKLDKIVVVDIEATCWDGKVPKGMKSDIIEVGVCLLDTKTGEISENEGIIVTPERSTISAFCTKLTTITPELIQKEGIPFKEALTILEEKYLSKSRTWASYGAYDLRQFHFQCKAQGLIYPFGPSHINVKTLFALKKKLEREIGMDESIKKLGFELEGTHHRGVDDARNIAKILNWILNN